MMVVARRNRPRLENNLLGHFPITLTASMLSPRLTWKCSTPTLGFAAVVTAF
jgi:hypothetical protein